MLSKLIRALTLTTLTPPAGWFLSLRGVMESISMVNLLFRVPIAQGTTGSLSTVFGSQTVRKPKYRVPFILTAQDTQQSRMSTIARS